MALPGRVQLLVDPCEGIEPGQTVTGRLSISADTADDRAVARWELYGDMLRVALRYPEPSLP